MNANGIFSFCDHVCWCSSAPPCHAWLSDVVSRGCGVCEGCHCGCGTCFSILSCRSQTDSACYCSLQKNSNKLKHFIHITFHSHSREGEVRNMLVFFCCCLFRQKYPPKTNKQTTLSPQTSHQPTNPLLTAA